MAARNNLPSEAADARAQIDAKKQEWVEKQKAIERAIRATFSTPDGMVALRWIKEQCHYGESPLAAVGGKIDEQATVYMAMQQSFYTKLRKLLPFSTLKEVEYNEDTFQ